jgi:hypothetical protein
MQDPKEPTHCCFSSVCQLYTLVRHQWLPVLQQSRFQDGAHASALKVVASLVAKFFPPHVVDHLKTDLISLCLNTLRIPLLSEDIVRAAVTSLVMIKARETIQIIEGLKSTTFATQFHPWLQRQVARLREPTFGPSSQAATEAKIKDLQLQLEDMRKAIASVTASSVRSSENVVASSPPPSSSSS